jgi:ribosomal protein S18 acetylase RimI-like enzyme
VVSGSDPGADIAALGDPRPLELADVEAAARAFARAFAWHEPWGEWAMPDPGDREERIFERFASDMRGRFLEYGECWTIGAAATTLWIPPNVPELAERRNEDEYAAFGPVAEQMRAGDALIRSLRPQQEHWYLDTIGTEPALHGKGLGGRLLDHDLAIRDASGHVCALDTHTEDNIGFYARRGFEVTGEGHLGPDISVYMMVRPSRPQ